MTRFAPSPQEESQPPPPAVGGRVMFWVLLLMAAAVFAPCVLLPVWREYQALHYAEQVERAELERARSELARQQRRLAALSSDPAAIARLARRELRYRAPGQVEVPVDLRRGRAEGVLDGEATSPKSHTWPELAAPEPPRAVAWIVDRLPDADYDGLFCAGTTRTLLMCLAGGLLISALVIYSPNGRPRQSP